MIYLILGLIVFLYIIRKSNTDDLIKEANITTEEQKNKFNENVLLIKSTKFSCILLAATLLSIATLLIIRNTSIELFFMNYFGDKIYKDELYIPILWYALPVFIIIIRGIIVEVNIGDYIKKTYNLTEIEVDVKGEVKNLLVKKKPSTKDTPTQTNEPNPVNENIIEPQLETTPITQESTATVEPVAPPTNEIQP